MLYFPALHAVHTYMMCMMIPVQACMLIWICLLCCWSFSVLLLHLCTRLSHLLQPASVSAAAFLPAPRELLFPRTMWMGGEALGNEWNRWQSSSRCCQGSCSSCAPSSLFRVERKTLDRKDEEPVVGPLAEGKECSAAFWNLPADLCQSAGN